MKGAAVQDSFEVSSYLSYWLHRLLEIKIAHADKPVSGWESTSFRGFLSSTIPSPATETLYHNSTYCGLDGLKWFDHRCFSIGQLQGPSRLSAGFHQLFPILVQMALLQRNEIVAIENPEVHLHPSLQLKVAEFLMHQAKGGKTILVETHSDLIIRRLMRAVLEEEIKQEALSIQFASLTKPAQPEAHSILEPLRINDRGQIENWPVGFLDDDIKESRRLFEVMYGALPEHKAEEDA